ncbi:MAG TPA: DUF1328 domain-containing protein [Bacteriovoracaceae bacterium]|nr:DUF1328 domain-containing protein [Bacteriovoracaceae bacterium]
MLRGAITFFILGIVSYFLGVNSIGGLSIEIGKILLLVFLVLSIVSFVVGLLRGKKGNLMVFVFLSLPLTAAMIPSRSLASERLVEATKEAGRDAKRGARATLRTAKDKTCELGNGKADCAVQKAKHSVQDAADSVEDAVE